MTNRQSKVGIPQARWLTILTGLVCVLVPWTSSPVLSFCISLVLVALMGSIIRALWSPSSHLASARSLLGLLVFTCILGGFGTLLLLAAQGAPILLVTIPAAMVVVLAPHAVLQTHPHRVLLAILATSWLSLVVIGAAYWTTPIDVESFVRQGLDAMANGRSPYAITIDNVYAPDETARVYGPGVVQDGTVVYGYPYLPAPLLLDLPVHLLADAIWMHLATMMGSVVLAWRMATDRLGRGAALAMGSGPSAALLILNYWIEPVMIALLTLTAYGLLKGKRWAVVAGLGLLFTSKQYALFFLPALWPACRSAGWRTIACSAVLGAVVLGTFIAMDPQAFVRSAVELQFKQPFRDDAISLLPAIRQVMGGFPGVLLGVLPFVGLVASGLVAARTRPGPTAFLLCVALGLLASVMVSKVGFVNYFMFIGAALLLAGITWPVDDPVQTREPLSQGSRGVLGMSKTR